METIDVGGYLRLYPDHRSQSIVDGQRQKMTEIKTKRRVIKGENRPQDFVCSRVISTEEKPYGIRTCVARGNHGDNHHGTGLSRRMDFHLIRVSVLLSGRPGDREEGSDVEWSRFRSVHQRTMRASCEHSFSVPSGTDYKGVLGCTGSPGRQLNPR